MSLFDRRELADYIRSVTISDTCSDDQNTANLARCLERFSTYDTAVKDLLSKALSSSNNKSLAFALTRRMFRRAPNTMDGALAMILVMAVNVEEIHVAVAKGKHLYLTSKALDLTWGDLDLARPSRPFQKLSELSIERKNGNDHRTKPLVVPMRPTLRVVRVVSCLIGKGPLTFPLSPVLCTLELVEAYITPNTLIGALSSGPLENLRRLSMNQVEDRDRGYRPDLSLWSMHAPNGLSAPRRLLQALAGHAPNLEVFEFYHGTYQHNSWPASFGTFKQLSKLHTLRIDTDRLVFADGMHEAQAINPGNLLPDSLRHLHITRIPYSRVNRYYGQVGAPTQVSSAMDLVLEVARNMPLHALYLEVGELPDFGTPGGVWICTELMSATASSLRELVNDDGNTSKDIRVYAESEAGPQAQSILLLSRGYRPPDDIWYELVSRYD